MLQNFPLFSEKSTASVICTSGLATSQQTLSLIDHATNIFGPRLVLQANLSNKINFGSDPGFFTGEKCLIGRRATTWHCQIQNGGNTSIVCLFQWKED